MTSPPPDPPFAPHLLGAAGEAAAAAFLEQAGLVVVDRNWRFCEEGLKGELDVVAREGSTVVVCEVKTRQTDRWGSPASAVGRVKAAQLRRLAVAWLREHAAEHPWTRGADVRFDVLAVVLTPAATRVEHLRAVL